MSESLGTDLAVAFPVARVLEAVAGVVADYPPAALFALADEGYNALFEVTVACIISVRTLEEDTFAVSRRLFARARTPAAIRALADDELLALLFGSTFPEPKAAQIKAIAARAETEFGGALPADYDTLLSLPGVGPKCAALALGVSTGASPHTPVDVHVHRVTNRWRLVATKTPEKTMAALDARLEPAQRVRINRLLVPFGKHLCTAALPACSSCPVALDCARVGVGRHR